MLRFVRDNKDRPFFLYYPTVIPHLPLQVPDEDLEPYTGEWAETPYTGTSYQPHPRPRAAYAAMISFMDKLGGSSEQQMHEYLFWDFAGYGRQIAVRMEKWKGIKPNLKDQPDGPLELYDLESDPSERHNVASENPDIAARIQQIMLEARTRPQIDRFAFGTYKD